MSRWKLDPAHTDVAFAAKHLMVTTVRGKFDGVEGELELDEEQPTRSRGEMRIAAASLSTGWDARDQHLKSADFFDAENHPTITVRATDVQPNGDRYKVTTDVTIRDETWPVVFDAEFLGVYSALDGKRRVGFHLQSRVNRKDWGLNWNVALEQGGWLVGDEIRLEVDVAGDEVQD